MADQSDEDLTVVVISGAAARGAYEAGALSEVLPRELKDLRNTVLLGTSAGAINAVLWASLADENKSLAHVGEEVCEIWRTLTADRVYSLPRPYLRSSLLRSVPFLPDLLRRVGIADEMTCLLDTAPLDATARELLDAERLHRNVQNGVVRGVGVVATSVPDSAAGGRSRVFLDTTLPDPMPDLTHRAIDFVRTPVDHDHVIASAAIPAMFPARLVQRPPAQRGYYVDGGVRLNTPLAPALALGAKRLIVVSSHPETYGRGEATEITPDVLQMAAQSIHVVLGDALIEDLMQMRRINRLLETTPLMEGGKALNRIPHLVVAPRADEGQLADMAATTKQAMQGHYHTLLLRVLLAMIGEGAGGNELLSFLRFDPSYMRALVELGKLHAQHSEFRF